MASSTRSRALRWGILSMAFLALRLMPTVYAMP